MAEQSRPTPCLPGGSAKIPGFCPDLGTLCPLHAQRKGPGRRGPGRAQMSPETPSQRLVSARQGPGNLRMLSCRPASSAHLGLPGLRRLLFALVRAPGDTGELSSRPLGLGRKHEQVCRASPTRGRVCEEGLGTALYQRPAPAFRRWAPPGRTLTPCQRAVSI